jgi:hypothetical protein
MSQCREVYAKFDKNPCVSEPINCFNPGVNQRFSLSKQGRLYEYGYRTEISIISNSEPFYTKVTTVSPLFVFTNCTEFKLAVAQKAL